MDLIQKWLAAKEKINVSPSLRNNTPSFFDRLKTSLRSTQKIEKVKRVTEDSDFTEDFKTVYPTFSDEIIQNAKRLRPFSSEYNILDLMNLAKNVRNLIGPGLVILWKAYEERKRGLSCDDFKWDNSQRLFAKLSAVRASALQKAREKIFPDLTDRINSGMLTEHDVSWALWKEQRYATELNKLGIEASSDRVGLLEKITAIYNSRTPTIKVADFYPMYPDHLLVHGITGSKNGNNRSLPNGINGFKSLFDYIINNRPTISCQAIQNTLDGMIWGSCGIILDKGDIQHASSQDAASVAISPNLRLPNYINEKPLSNQIDGAINCVSVLKRFPYNEFLVANPGVKGFYYVSGEMIGTFPIELGELAQLAVENNLPLYRFDRGEGFREVDVFQGRNKAA